MTDEELAQEIEKFLSELCGEKFTYTVDDVRKALGRAKNEKTEKTKNQP